MERHFFYVRKGLPNRFMKLNTDSCGVCHKHRNTFCLNTFISDEVRLVLVVYPLLRHPSLVICPQLRHQLLVFSAISCSCSAISWRVLPSAARVLPSAARVYGMLLRHPLCTVCSGNWPMSTSFSVGYLRYTPFAENDTRLHTLPSRTTNREAFEVLKCMEIALPRYPQRQQKSASIEPISALHSKHAISRL
jgi:hypothetical protein